MLDKVAWACYSEAVPGEKSFRGVRSTGRRGIWRRGTEVKKLLLVLGVLIVLVGTGLAVFLTLFGDEGEATPLAGSVQGCRMAAGPGELIACEKARGVALTYMGEEYAPGGLVKVNQYFLVPLSVASVDDLRAKRDWAWEHWDVWEREDIDICRAKLGVFPNSLMSQLQVPEDFSPRECLAR